MCSCLSQPTGIIQGVADIQISIFGSGFVGLVTGACLVELGHTVVCLDVDPSRVETINNGKAPFHEPDLDDLLQHGIADKRLRASQNLDDAAGADIYFIATGTPTRDGQIDLSQIESAAATIGAQIADADGFPVVVVKSTVVPGTTIGVVSKVLEDASGKVAGRDFGLCMNPEFLRESSAVADFRGPDRIIIGADDLRTVEIMQTLYSSYDCPSFTMSPSGAEMSKYVSNCFLATLISFSNEFARLCERFDDTDIEAVMDTLAADRRLSPRVDDRIIAPGILSYLRPGIGYGGSCLPKDVAALRHLARTTGAPAKLLDAVDEINEMRADGVVAAAEAAAGDFADRKVAVLGLAFKPGTDDVRQSPALKAIDHLLERGANVCAYDPLVPALATSPAGLSHAGTALDALDGAHAAIIATGWQEFADLDWAAALRRMAQPVVADGRNLLAAISRPEEMIYIPVGRRLANSH